MDHFCRPITQKTFRARSRRSTIDHLHHAIAETNAKSSGRRLSDGRLSVCDRSGRNGSRRRPTSSSRRNPLSRGGRHR